MVHEGIDSETFGQAMSEEEKKIQEEEAIAQAEAMKPDKQAKRKEYDVAKEVFRVLNRPVAAITDASGNAVVKVWTYTRSNGWQTDTRVRALCDQIHGSHGGRVFSIIGSNFAMNLAQMNQSCFLEWIPTSSDKFNGYWQELDAKPHEIYFSDGVYNLKENTFDCYNDRIIFGPLITCPYEPEAYDEEFVSSIKRHFIGRDEEYRRFQQECGKMLRPHVPNKYEVYVVSNTVDNGKSSMVNAIAAAPGGRDGYSTVRQEELVDDQFALAALINKFSNVSNDASKSPKWASILHKLTSGPVSLRFMYKEPVQVSLPAKLWNTCNSMQVLDDSLGNLSNRVKMFEFRGAAYPRIGRDGEDIYMRIEYWGSLQRRSAIVNWMLDGLLDLIEKGPALEPNEMREKYLAEADPERAVFKERVQVTGDKADFVPSSELVAFMFPGEKDTATKQLMRLSHRMKTLFGLDPERRRVDGKPIRGYSGITITA